jgi:hypothetical protein
MVYTSQTIVVGLIGHRNKWDILKRMLEKLAIHEGTADEREALRQFFTRNIGTAGVRIRNENIVFDTDQGVIRVVVETAQRISESILAMIQNLFTGKYHRNINLQLQPA